MRTARSHETLPEKSNNPAQFLDFLMKLQQHPKPILTITPPPLQIPYFFHEKNAPTALVRSRRLLYELPKIGDIDMAPEIVVGSLL